VCSSRYGNKTWLKGSLLLYVWLSLKSSAGRQINCLSRAYILDKINQRLRCYVWFNTDYFVLYYGIFVIDGFLFGLDQSTINMFTFQALPLAYILE